jgi:hypothetical protein
MNFRGFFSSNFEGSRAACLRAYVSSQNISDGFHKNGGIRSKLTEVQFSHQKLNRVSVKFTVAFSASEGSSQAA